MTERVVVVGGGLSGMAAAARLAKARYAVTLYERSDRLGGRWAARSLLDGVLVDDGPAVLGFPAPWRDLFRKSGRPLEAELSRIGTELVPASPTVITFADGSVMNWPADRGGQQAALTRSFGVEVAQRWQDFVDRLDRLWQVLRPLGWEAERPPGRLTARLGDDCSDGRVWRSWPTGSAIQPLRHWCAAWPIGRERCPSRHPRSRPSTCRWPGRSAAGKWARP